MTFQRRKYDHVTDLLRSGVAREARGCGPHRAALARAANGRKLYLKIHVKIQIVFVCNKNIALQPARAYRPHGRL